MSLSLAHFASGAYAASFLEAISSIYPGFHGGRTIGDVILGTVYALIDGALGGLIFAWLYNLFAPRTA